MDDSFVHRYTILPVEGGKRRYISFVYRGVNIAGAYYHDDALRKFCMKESNGRFTAMFDPGNPHDKNAIVLKNEYGETLGYVPRDIAADIAFSDDKDYLYIRPRYKRWEPNRAIFIFDIVRILNPALMTDEEFLLYVKIQKRKLFTITDDITTPVCKNESLTHGKYKCVLCNNNFDKPKTKSFGSFWMELGLLLLSIFLYFIFPAAGTLLFAIILCVSVFRSLSISRKKVCPYCGSENFIKRF